MEAVRYLGAPFLTLLCLSSLASSLAVLTSSSSSAACSVPYSKPLHRPPPSSTWGSCQIQVSLTLYALGSKEVPPSG